MKDTLDSDGDIEDGGEEFESSEYAPEAQDPGVFWCPKCGAEMFGDAPRCPSCGDFVTPGARPSTRTPWWIWAGLILIGLTMLAGVVASLLH